MFERRLNPFDPRVELNSQFQKLSDIVKKALGDSAKQWVANPKTQSLDFSRVQREALEGPYGLILKQFNEAMIMFAIIEHYHIVIIDKIEEKQKLIQELEDEIVTSEKKEADDDGKPPNPTKEELILEQTTLETESKKLTQVKRTLTNQLALQLVRHIKAIDHFITVTAHKEILSRSKELGYQFNDKERAIIETPVLRSDLERILRESHQKAQEVEIAELAKKAPIAPTAPTAPGASNIPDAPVPPKPEIHRDFPKSEDFAARSLADLELRTLMALNAYWNRQVNEIIDPPNPTESNHHNGTAPKSINEAIKLTREAQTTPQESSGLQKLRQEFTAKYEQDKKEAESGASGQKRPAFNRSRRDSRVIYNAGDSLSLLKEFHQTFTSLEVRFNKLNDLHKGQTEEIYAKMRQLIDTEKSSKKEIDATLQPSPSLGKN